MEDSSLDYDSDSFSYEYSPYMNTIIFPPLGGDNVIVKHENELSDQLRDIENTNYIYKIRRNRTIIRVMGLHMALVEYIENAGQMSEQFITDLAFQQIKSYNPIQLYRGMRFKEEEMPWPNAIADTFMELKDRLNVSSWTTRIDVAKIFALCDESFPYGIIFGYVAHPDEVLIDINILSSRYNGLKSENEVILLGRERMVEIIWFKKYTKQQRIRNTQKNGIK